MCRFSAAWESAPALFKSTVVCFNLVQPDVPILSFRILFFNQSMVKLEKLDKTDNGILILIQQFSN